MNKSKMIQWKDDMLMHAVLKHFGGLVNMGVDAIGRCKAGLIIRQNGKEQIAKHGDWIARDGKGLKVIPGEGADKQ
ncbi:hypothetical protein [Paenibacillus xylanexedens]|uniref:hypothetical protein n=1 Tax=Paenibacillus xylanexedens TaxID=528191 RepID=UPI000F541CCE|nr:hypothetical protein [Paenibacillus xylanexedens]RPK29851.1 hypothetical protein EDO6_00475 [Paenibacillus xylanexedens]